MPAAAAVVLQHTLRWANVHENTTVNDGSSGGFTALQLTVLPPSPMPAPQRSLIEAAASGGLALAASAGGGSGGSGNDSGGSDGGWLAKCPQCPQIQRMPGAEEAGVCDWCGHVLTKVEHAIKGPRQLQTLQGEGAREEPLRTDHTTRRRRSREAIETSRS